MPAISLVVEHFREREGLKFRQCIQRKLKQKSGWQVAKRENELQYTRSLSWFIHFLVNRFVLPFETLSGSLFVWYQKHLRNLNWCRERERREKRTDAGRCCGGWCSRGKLRIQADCITQTNVRHPSKHRALLRKLSSTRIEVNPKFASNRARRSKKHWPN